MRKFGKYEKMRKNAIMQTYITSLLCLVLCVTMFFGTTMAWFTDTTVSNGNEMYVGTLDVDLKHASFMNGSLGAYAEVNSDYQVFKKIENGGIRWEPGYTAVEKFELTENGDLAFSYQLGIECKFENTLDGETTVVSKEAKEAIAKAITVWSYVGDDAETVTTLPENFDELTAGQWEEIGTLYDVITEKLPVFKGQMDKEAVTATKTEGENTVEDPAKAYHLIALNMDKNFDGFIKDATGAPTEATVQGQTLDNITIKLVATQLPSEQDAFGSNYDNYVEVATAEELQEALNAAVDGRIIQFTADITAEDPIVVNQPGDKNVTITIDGKGYKYDGQIKIQGNSSFNHDNDESLVIQNIKFETAAENHDFIWSADTASGSIWRYAHNVTIDNCTFTASGVAVHTAVGIRFQQAYNIVVKNCTATNMHSLLQAESCGSTVTVDTCKVVNGKNGVSFNNTMNAVIKNSDIESVVEGGYGVRHKGEQNNYSLSVDSCKINAFVPVLIRNMTASSYTATLSGSNTLTATNDFGYQIVLSAGDWDNDSAQPTVPTGTYTLTGADGLNVFGK